MAPFLCFVSIGAFVTEEHVTLGVGVGLMNCDSSGSKATIAQDTHFTAYALPLSFASTSRGCQRLPKVRFSTGVI